MADEPALQGVIVASEDFDTNKKIEKIALFNPDGSPWPGVIGPSDGAIYTLSTQLGLLTTRVAALETTVAGLQASITTNAIKILVGLEPVPNTLPDNTIIARLIT